MKANELMIGTTVREEDLSPIPLTDEILDKNRLEKKVISDDEPCYEGEPFTCSYIFNLRPYIRHYNVKPSKICRGYISQIARDKARKKHRRKKRK